MNFINKYSPQSTKDILCNYKQISDIKAFLKNFEENPKKKIEDKILLILGPSGSCKTNICKCIFKECDLEPIKLDLFSTNNLKDNILQGIRHNTFECFLTNKKKVLFLDDIDLICQYEKTFISFIIKLIKNIKIPIVCTSNVNDDKKISEIRKKASKIYIRRIGYKECFQFINNIIQTENINLDLELVLKLVNNNNCDIRLILSNLNKYIDNCDEESNNTTILSNKDTYIDFGLFDLVKEIFNKNINNNELDNLIHNDCSLISLLLHENLPSEFVKIKNKNSLKLSMINSFINILDIYTFADSIEKYIYVNNDWYLYDHICIMKLFGINYEINKFPRISSDYNIVFTQLLTKSSLRFNYKKKKRNLYSKLCFDDNSSTDYVFQILLQYIQNSDNETIFNKDDIDCITKYAEVFNIINKDDRKFLMNKIKNRK
jgi:hypothetical protein